MKILIGIFTVGLLATLIGFSNAEYKSSDKLPDCVETGRVYGDGLDDCSRQYPHLTNKKVREYEALEKALTSPGVREAIINQAASTGCFDRIKIVNGKEVKNCYVVMIPAGRNSKWICEPFKKSEKPECYE